MLFYEWMDIWVSVYKNGNVKKATLKNYLYATKLIKRNLENSDINNYTEMKIQKFLQKLYKQGYAKSTIRLTKLTLNQIFKRAVKEKLIYDNPVEYAKVPLLAPEKTVQSLSLSDEEKVRAAAEHDLMGHLAIFLFLTGLRRCELINLKWEDYDAHQSIIRITKSKTKKGERIVPLTPKAKAIIEKQFRRNDYIFCSSNKKQITETVVRKMCERVSEASGVKFSTHICRHTFATRLYEKGADIKSLSKLLGHSSIGFTIQRYVTTSLEQQRQAIALIEDIA